MAWPGLGTPEPKAERPADVLPVEVLSEAESVDSGAPACAGSFRMGCQVTTYERQPELAASARERLARLGFSDRVEVRLADGSLGDPDAQPYPRIIVTAAAPRIPDTLREQLADGGRMVIPVGSRDRQDLLVVTRHGDEWEERSDGACVFVPLIGEGGFEK